MSFPTDRRTSPRIAARVPLIVEARDTSGQEIREETHTILFNDAGALIPLVADLQRDGPCRITNQRTGVGVSCRITWRSSTPLEGRWSYVINLVDASPNFWDVKVEATGFRADRRTSQRVRAKIPLLIEARDTADREIHEDTYTILVNDAGALLPLAADLARHDPCWVTNRANGFRVASRVTWRSSAQLEGRWTYALALISAPDSFWEVKVEPVKVPSPADRRTSARITARIPVVVELPGSSGGENREKTHTIQVNDGGALISLAAQMEADDGCRIINPRSGAAADSRVVWRSGAPLEGRWGYAIAFLKPDPNFWGTKE